MLCTNAPSRTSPTSEEGRAVATRTGKATCCYCGVGCVLTVKAAHNRVIDLTADPDAEPTFGMMCPKGALLTKAGVGSDGPGAGRLLHPMLREHRGAPLRRASWGEAVAFIARRLRDYRDRFGPRAIAYYGSGQLDTEASYVFNKLFKGGLRSNNTDTNSRLCMSSAVAGYVAAFGSDGPPTCYDDIDHADTFFILGANMAANHPVLFNRVRRRRAMDDGVRIIVIDPRRSKTAEYADVHVPVAPGGDVALLQLLSKRLIDAGRVNHDFVHRHTDHFDRYHHLLSSLDEAELLARCGVSAETVDACVDVVGRDARLLSFYCMGANQSSRGTDKNTAIINLHLQLGELCKPGAGPFSLTGQPNAMGGREVGYLCHQLPGYRFVANAAHREEVEQAWGLPPGAIDAEPGLPAVAMFEAAARGEIKAIWVACTNPAVSMPDANTAQEGLRRAELVIVQDCFSTTETTAFADVLLPAAQWGEKSGTMTNSERLVTRSTALLDAPGEAMPDWWIAAAVGRALGFHGFDYASHEEVWDEYRKLTRGTLCDQSGMTNERLDQGPLRWPCPDETHPGTRRRYADRRFPTPTGRARFVASHALPPAEATDADHPLQLTTGRVAYQWHTRTKTGLVPELVRQEPEPFIEIHPDDAAARSLADGQRVRIASRRGVAEAKLRFTLGIRPGLLFMPFHWGDLFEPHSNANDVTSPACDPVSKQPELKFAAVRIDAIGEPRIMGAGTP